MLVVFAKQINKYVKTCIVGYICEKIVILTDVAIKITGGHTNKMVRIRRESCITYQFINFKILESH